MNVNEESQLNVGCNSDCDDVDIVGLDLSLTSTGICVDGECSAIATASKGAERLHWLRTVILDRITEVQFPVVCIEGYSFGSRNSQAHAIGELGGVIRVALWEKSIPWIDIPPTCRAKFATGKGNASKNEVVSAISARTGIVWSGKGADDMCDAWILREMALAHLGKTEFSWPQINLTSLQTIDWSALNAYNQTPHQSQLLINVLEKNEQAN
jgi:Holliday junction resolvasome RuvABC endonuclease subunit